MAIIDKIRDFSQNNGLFTDTDGLLVALSGGADSVALLVALQELHKGKLAAAHFNHLIRGAEADKDEAFCRDLCERLGVPIYIGRADVPAYAQHHKLSVETAARDCRYAYLEATAAEHNMLICTAHNANDLAETFLMNVGRGTGLHGLSSIPVRRGNIVRPLLSCTRSEIETYLAERGQSFCTDSTNLVDDCTRNVIRHRVLPELLNVFPDGIEKITRAVQALREDDAYLAKQASMVREEYERYGVAAILAAEECLQVRCISDICFDLCGARIEATHIAAVKKMLKCGRGICALPNGRVTLKDGRIVLYTPPIKSPSAAPEPIIITGEGRYTLCGVTLEVADTQKYTDVYKNANYILLPRDILCGASLRTAAAGDSVYLPRRHIHKPLRKLFSEQGVPPNERKKIPLIAIGNSVVAVFGMDLGTTEAEAADCFAIRFIKE